MNRSALLVLAAIGAYLWYLNNQQQTAAANAVPDYSGSGGGGGGLAPVAFTPSINGSSQSALNAISYGTTADPSVDHSGANIVVPPLMDTGGTLPSNQNSVGQPTGIALYTDPNSAANISPFVASGDLVPNGQGGYTWATPAAPAPGVQVSAPAPATVVYGEPALPSAPSSQAQSDNVTRPAPSTAAGNPFARQSQKV